MTDPDDEALSWEGDDRLQAPPRAPAATAPRERRVGAGGGGAGLVALGVLGGVAVIESVFWVRSALSLSIADSITPTGATVWDLLAFAVNVTGRVLAVAAPLVWYAAVLRLVRAPARRLALLVLGALVLVPWPIVLIGS